MTDNFENMRRYLEKIGKLPTDNPGGKNDKYYVIELMRRGKDNPDLPAANVHFKNYYITCMSDYDKYMEDIKDVCEALRLRAYISVNYKSFGQVTLDTIAEMARRVAAHDIKRSYAIWESCSGKYVAAGDGKWVIDVDREPWMTDTDFERYLELLRGAINGCRSNHKVGGSNIIWENPSMTGHHFVTVGFKVVPCHEYNKVTGETVDNQDSWPERFFEVIRELLGSKIHHYHESYENSWFPKTLITDPTEMIHENHVTLLYENLGPSQNP